MPTGKNWFNFVYINVAFLMYILGVFYYSKVEEIKKNWPMYRCNPVYMPLADNVNENFTYCIQNMQVNYLQFLLEPLTFITGALGGMIGGLVGQVEAVRAMFAKLRTFIPNIFTNLFGSFSVLTVEFEKINVSIRDIIGKTMAVVVSVMYILDGSVKTMTSGYRFVSGIGKCFHPNTRLELQNGTIKEMKDIHLGDILKDGSKVISTMQIDNTIDKIPFYVIKNGKENIYVTGSHYVYDSSLSKFIPVENYSKAEISNVTSEWFTCLITDKHHIPIGNEIFWDWEDYVFRKTI